MPVRRSGPSDAPSYQARARLMAIPSRTFATDSQASTAGLERVEDVLPADQHHRVDAVGEQAGHRGPLEPVGLVLEPVRGACRRGGCQPPLARDGQRRQLEQASDIFFERLRCEREVRECAALLAGHDSAFSSCLRW